MLKTESTWTVSLLAMMQESQDSTANGEKRTLLTASQTHGPLREPRGLCYWSWKVQKIEIIKIIWKGKLLCRNFVCCHVPRRKWKSIKSLTLFQIFFHFKLSHNRHVIMSGPMWAFFGLFLIISLCHQGHKTKLPWWKTIYEISLYTLDWRIHKRVLLCLPDVLALRVKSEICKDYKKDVVKSTFRQSY